MDMSVDRPLLSSVYPQSIEGYRAVSWWRRKLRDYSDGQEEDNETGQKETQETFE